MITMTAAQARSLHQGRELIIFPAGGVPQAGNSTEGCALFVGQIALQMSVLENNTGFLVSALDATPADTAFKRINQLEGLIAHAGWRDTLIRELHAVRLFRNALLHSNSLTAKRGAVWGVASHTERDSSFYSFEELKCELSHVQLLVDLTRRMQYVLNKIDVGANLDELGFGNAAEIAGLLAVDTPLSRPRNVTQAWYLEFVGAVFPNSSAGSAVSP